MNDEKIRCLIERIEGLAGPCIYDDDEIDEATDVFEIQSDEYVDMGFEIDVESLFISPFISFGYCDFEKDEVEKGHYDTDEIENEERTKLLESSFTLYAKAHSPNYVVSVWDDGSYMCPGFVARVGFRLEEYSDELIRQFLSVYREYINTVGCLNDSELRRFIFKSICHSHTIKVTGDSLLSIGGAAIKFSDSKNLPNNNIEHYYLGNEKFLFSVLGQHYAAEVCPMKMFLEAQNMCELFDDVFFYFENPPLFDVATLQVISAHMVLSIQASADIHRLYSRIEESATIISHSNFVPFASEQFREVYLKAYAGSFDSFSSEYPLIITEGSTDWKHLKKYWEQYAKQSLKINFFEYEPANSTKNGMLKQEMGSATLLEMCRAYSKMTLGKVFIFISDRDESKIVKEMGDDIKHYKCWGNGVYSFALPVPTHRVSTPEICIEHCYSDEEIKTYYECTDGRKRRLFLGNDFDGYGRDTEHGLLCIKRSLCGPESIKIIDGSSGTRVISMNEKNDINHALSKQEFACRSTIKKDSPTYSAFDEIFKIIQEIVQDSKRQR